MTVKQMSGKLTKRQQWNAYKRIEANEKKLGMAHMAPEWEQRLDMLTQTYGPEARIEIAKFGDRLIEDLQGRSYYWNTGNDVKFNAEQELGRLRILLRETAGVTDE